jgi:uncharacterized protein YdhG (YjbR/CyaY superfamily)
MEKEINDQITFHLEKLAKRLYPEEEGYYAFKTKKGDYVFGHSEKRIQVPEDIARILVYGRNEGHN